MPCVFTLLHRVDGFRCLADIVVATPGRLVDHTDQTPGFSLQHLRFLVCHLEGVLGSELTRPQLPAPGPLASHRSSTRPTG